MNYNANYRVWDFDRKQMIYPDDKFIIVNGKVVLKLSPNFTEDLYYPLENRNGERFHFMADSGCVDMIENKLYIDDIITNDFAIWQVIFLNGCFSAMPLFTIDPGSFVKKPVDAIEGRRCIALRAVKGMKKIGNIHQNKNLLHV